MQRVALLGQNVGERNELANNNARITLTIDLCARVCVHDCLLINQERTVGRWIGQETIINANTIANRRCDAGII